MGQKKHFCKSYHGLFGMLKQVCLAHFEPVVTHFGLRKIPKCFENVRSLDRKWVNNGSKKPFLQKSTWTPCDAQTSVFSPCWAFVGPTHGHLTGQNFFSQNCPRPFGMLPQMLLAHFQPVVMHIRPQQTLKCFENGSFCDQKCVKNRSKKHFSKSFLGLFRTRKQ